jgi:hypothetical protein
MADSDSLNGASADHIPLWHSIFALVVIVWWLTLFIGGLLVDTLPYRLVFSPPPPLPPNLPSSIDGVRTVYVGSDPASVHPVVAWVVVLAWYLPANWLWLCATASILGALGNRANLGDEARRPNRRLRPSPYLAAALRGFFVYLFAMAFYVLVEDSPFSSVSPRQFLRTAPLLSAVSFLSSYQPKFFRQVIVWAARHAEREYAGADSSVRRPSKKGGKDLSGARAAAQATEPGPRP